MTKKGFGWKFLAVVLTAALLASGTWVKAADAADLTHHEVTLKDEMGKPLGQAHCVIRDKEGNYLANVIASVDGLIVAMAHPGATLRCVSKELEVHEGEVKAGRKIVTMKQPLFACYVCDTVTAPFEPNWVAEQSCCADYKQCRWAFGSCISK